MSEFVSDFPVEPGQDVTDELFRIWRSPRVGTKNPERLANPVWDWLIRSRASAYSASQRFGLGGPTCGDPGWSFARFGQSVTTLDDGRVVYIAGEHEDHYDPDFYIYNDVVIQNPDGSIEVYGYPHEAFPPTDFHSATVAGDRIVVIGNAGYPEQRKPGVTQVVSIDLATLSSSLIETREESPGWIHGHEAILENDGSIVISGGRVETRLGPRVESRENGDYWRLDLGSWLWERITDRKWRSWQMSRVDHEPMHLWRVRSLAQSRGVRWAAEYRDSMNEMIREEMLQVKMAYGAEPDLDLFATLFEPALVHTSIADNPEEFGTHRIHVDGIVVRYVERMQSVKVVIEGRLPDEICSAIVNDLRGKLTELEHAEYEVTEL